MVIYVQLVWLMDSHLSVSSGIFTDFESSVFVYAITCLISFRRKLMQSRITCQREPLLPLAQMGGFYVPLLILEAGFPRAPGSGGGHSSTMEKRRKCQRGVWVYRSPSDSQQISSTYDIFIVKLWTGKTNITIAFRFKMKKSLNSKFGNVQKLNIRKEFIALIKNATEGLPWWSSD